MSVENNHEICLKNFSKALSFGFQVLSSGPGKNSSTYVKLRTFFLSSFGKMFVYFEEIFWLSIHPQAFCEKELEFFLSTKIALPRSESVARCWRWRRQEAVWWCGFGGFLGKFRDSLCIMALGCVKMGKPSTEKWTSLLWVRQLAAEPELQPDL